MRAGLPRQNERNSVCILGRKNFSTLKNGPYKYLQRKRMASPVQLCLIKNCCKSPMEQIFLSAVGNSKVTKTGSLA